MGKNQNKTYTLKLSENTMKKMEEYFQDKKRLKTPPYAVFQADEADTVVTLYQSGKAVFQGISADIDANMWKEMERHLNPGKKIDEKVSDNKKKASISQKNIFNCSTIGSDEVGTGDYFGPIVVCASYVKKEDIPFLQELNIKDSKELDDAMIMKLVPKIIKRIPYSCMILTNYDYNNKYSNKINLNTIKAILHNKVLNDMKDKYPNYDYIVVDQFVNPKAYFNYLKNVPNVTKNITFTTKAENKCYSVACSAIISRYVFLQEFEKLSLTLGVNLPKGAGDKVDEVGAEIVKVHGIEILKEIAKLNFKNTEKIKDLIK